MLRWFLVMLLVAMVACSRRASEPSGTVPFVEGAASGSADAPAEGSAVAVDAPAPPPPPPLPLAPAFETGVASFPIGSSGGALVAGDARLDVPAGALASDTTIELRAVGDSEALGNAPPVGFLLGAVHGSPWNLPLERTAELVVPLRYEVPVGTPLELLAYHEQMRSYIVIGNTVATASAAPSVEGSGDAARPESTTRATFRVRQLGDMVVRARPVRAEGAAARCPGEGMRVHEKWPGAAEAEVVGLVPEEERIPREVAFGLLTDFRLADAFDLVEFKNEEVNDLGATRRDERNHVDEDFLMDPNAAAAVSALAALVRDEWVDPFSGVSAQRLRITESYDALIEHSVQSTHYQGRGIDLTVTPIPVASPEERGEWYGRLSRLSVCAGFDYVLFENLYHVHASVVPTEVGVALATAEGSAGVVSTTLARFEVGTPEREVAADALRTGRLAWTDDGALAIAEGSADGRVTADGMRRVVVQDGQLFLVNTSGQPPIGSVERDGTPVDVRYPFPLTDVAVEAVDAAVRPHQATAGTRHQLRR